MLDDLEARLDEVTVRDAERLRRRIDSARRKGAPDELLAELAAEVERSAALVAERRAGAPTPTYPEGLPVTARRQDLLDAIAAHQVVVVAGETGSGKSTQLPKLCLELGRGARGMIGHTQPRRLAARTVSERIAEELGEQIGGTVGYTVRFTDEVSRRTLVKVMTDGILLNEVQRDRTLSAYDTLIVDEAHERSLNIDFLLGYLTQLLPRRPDLKLVVTSATIDTERFSRHFGGAPVVEVSGRSFPVEVRYRPLVPDDDEIEDAAAQQLPDRASASEPGGDGARAQRAGAQPPGDGAEPRDQVQAVCEAVQELAGEGPGDVLVFLSGEREIRDTAEAVERLALPRTEVLALYARLSAAEQHRAFQPHDGRRVVLATNVAETSITVPGIRYVVDAGTARISRYNRRTKVQRLPIEPISQASANQRAGRCGRVAPGTCIRLYAEDDLEARPAFTEPEILRTNLASVILQMAALGLGDVADFPFVEPPDGRAIADGLALLHELGALEPDDARPPKGRGGKVRGGRRRGRHRPAGGPTLTPVGRQLARLPVDPRLGRMVVEAHREGCAAEVLVIAAALAIQDVRERPTGKESLAAESHNRFADPDSDHLSTLALWRHLRARQREMGSSRFRRLCRDEYLHHLRVREWQDVHGQLRQIARTVGITSGPVRAELGPADRDAVHRSLLAGLLSQIGLRDGDTREYQGARGSRFAIAPGSSVRKATPRWVVAGELVETNRMWARGVARIDPRWVEELGDHLVTRTYGEVSWDERRGAATTVERVTLHGVPVVAGRAVQLDRVDPEGARIELLRNALLDGRWPGHHAFVAANEATMDEVRALEQRVRRHDLLVDPEAVYDLYDARVPDHVTTVRRFDRWWKQERERRPDLLTFTVEELTDPDALAGVEPADFPTVWRQGDLALPLTYVHDIESPIDGVMIDVPLEVLDRVDADRLSWHVPGLRLELVDACIRALPKAVRRLLVPVPAQAEAFLSVHGPGDGALLDVLTRWLAPRAATAVHPHDVDVERIPPHLRWTFRVIGTAGDVVDADVDLAELRRRLRPQVRDAIAAAAPGLERSGLTAWPAGDLPRAVAVRRAGATVTAHPALVDEGDSVAVRVLPTAGEQAAAMRAGTRRLLLLTGGVSRKAVLRRLRNQTALTLASSGARAGGGGAVVDDCTATAVDRIVTAHGGPAWDEAGFDALRRAVRDELPDASVRLTTIAAGVLAAAAAVDDRLARLVAPALDDAVLDVRRQLDRLVRPGFVGAAGARRLPDVLRYVRAVERRLDRLADDPHRDRRLLAEVRGVERRYEDLLVTLPTERLAELGPLHWELEELRVATFAQAVGAKGAPSAAKLGRRLDEIGRTVRA